MMSKLWTPNECNIFQIQYTVPGWLIFLKYQETMRDLNMEVYTMTCRTTHGDSKEGTRQTETSP